MIICLILIIVLFAASSANRVEKEPANVDTHAVKITAANVKSRLVQRRNSNESGSIIALRIIFTGSCCIAQ